MCRWPSDVPGKLFIKLNETEALAAIAKRLAEQIGNVWAGEMFSAKSRGPEVVITCDHDSIEFYPMLNGVEPLGREIIEVEQ
jgi:hypothetical protein